MLGAGFLQDPLLPINADGSRGSSTSLADRHRAPRNSERRLSSPKSEICTPRAEGGGMYRSNCSHMSFAPAGEHNVGILYLVKLNNILNILVAVAMRPHFGELRCSPALSPHSPTSAHPGRRQTNTCPEECLFQEIGLRPIGGNVLAFNGSVRDRSNVWFGCRGGTGNQRVAG